MGVGEGLTGVSDSDGAPFGSIVSSLDELAELYRAPGRIAASKKTAVLDDASRGIVSRSPFVLIGTDGADGGLDVSPRGGPPGFVRVLDQRHVAIPDLNGNNVIDSLRGVVASLRGRRDRPARRRVHPSCPGPRPARDETPLRLVPTNDAATREFLEQSYLDDLARDAPD